MIMVVPVGIPFSTGVFIMTTISVGVADPTATGAGAVVVLFLTVFRLFPASVPITVAHQARAMIAIPIATFVRMSQHGTRSRQDKHPGDSEERVLEGCDHITLSNL